MNLNGQPIDGRPAGHCPSCERALDLGDARAMAALNMCEWCRACSEPRRIQARADAIVNATPTGTIAKEEP